MPTRSAIQQALEMDLIGTDPTESDGDEITLQLDSDLESELSSG